MKTPHRAFRNVLLGLICILAVDAPPASAQEPLRIEKIRSNLDQWVNEVVTIEGIVEQYVDNTAQTTRFYFLKDDWGSVLRIRTSGDYPEANGRYRVTGPVSFEVGDRGTRNPYMSEETRQTVAELQPITGTVGPNITPPPPPLGPGGTTVGPTVITPPVVVRPKRDWTTMVLFGGAGMLALLMIGLSVWFVSSRRAQQDTSTLDLGGRPISDRRSIADSMPVLDNPAPQSIIEDRTIKLHAPPPGTLKLLPARFVVEGGLDDIQYINFFRAQGQKDTEITFGRAQGMPYRHIQLKPRTVSSRQAKLIFTNNQFTLINYASEDSNPTSVNGVAMSVNDSVVLKAGDKISMGEVGFRFESLSEA